MRKQIFLLACNSEAESMKIQLASYLKDMDPTLQLAGIERNRVSTAKHNLSVDCKDVVEIYTGRESVRHTLRRMRLFWQAKNFIINTKQDIIITMGDGKITTSLARRVRAINQKIIFVHITSVASFYRQDNLLTMTALYHKIFSLLPLSLISASYIESRLSDGILHVGSPAVYESFQHPTNIAADDAAIIAIALGVNSMSIKRNLSVLRNVILSLRAIDSDFAFLLLLPLSLRDSVRRALYGISGISYGSDKDLAANKLPRPRFAILDASTNIIGIASLGIPMLVYRSLSFRDRLFERCFGKESDYANAINAIAQTQLIPKVVNVNDGASLFSPFWRVTQKQFCERIVHQFCQIFFYRSKLINQTTKVREILLQCGARQARPPMEIVASEVLNMLKEL